MRRDVALRLSLLVTLVSAAAALPIACAAGIETAGEGGASASSTSAGGAGSTTASAGGAGPATSTSTGSGPCTTAAECEGSSDACNVGACINGACSKLVANEAGACDDGKTCTQNDHCEAGVCTGSLVFCPSDDACHLGLCDVDLDACVQVAGNDGASCTDDDPCTLNGTCGGGACLPGASVDCSFLDSTCAVGMCDAQIGCVTQALNDGSACDDSFYCTINDTCTNGMCAGAPNTCAAPGDICMIGSCNEQTDTCVAVPGNDGVACDDLSTCTTGEKCSNGLCGGGAATNNGGACDDQDACSTISACNAVGGCIGGAPILGCVSGDGCCPAGCDGNVDDDCTPPTSFNVLATKDVNYNGIDYLLLKVSFKSDTSIADNWCFEYTNLCAFYGYVPTGCGQTYTSMANGYGDCKNTYLSDGISDSLGCNASGGVQGAAQAAGYNDATTENSFAFHYCDASTCQKTMCSGQYCNTALSYIDMTKPHGYTLCNK